MNSQTNPKSASSDDNLNMNFNQPPEQPNSNSGWMLNAELNMNKNIDNLAKIDDKEQKRINDRQKEVEERREKINKKIQKEEELRNKIIKKAKEYMLEFEEKRQENIKKRKKLLKKK